ncbi:MAG: pyrroloquinoline-quinone synthase PqqC, partial [Gammaproteobacteria bacterium]
MNNPTEQAPWSREEFKTQLLQMERYYHIHHPYHLLMNEGKLNKAQIQGWVANRFYYQISIPIKDAAIMANCPDRESRALWVQRIIDHDGAPQGNAGGIEAWLQLGQAVGLDREEIISQKRVLPGVRFAVDAYVNFARRADWHEAASSSLTELFAPKIHQQRLDNWP